ncbi:MAG: energy transducer TonB [Verrucomicrobia bacterium]|nr:energy transducer TonB [Verrucomicrobiota bacterium]
MPTYRFWLISLALHATALTVAVPGVWFEGPDRAQPFLSIKFVPPQQLTMILPPPPASPRLGGVFRSDAPKPAPARASAAAPATPRLLKVAGQATPWCRMPTVSAPVEVPQTDPKAVAASAAVEAAPTTGPNEGGPAVGENTAAAVNSDGPLGMPSYSRTPLPAYPRVAKLRGWEGVTVLRVEVREDGSVGHIEMVRSSGHSLLDETAMKSVREWRFEPARRGNTAVACVIEVPIRFKLDNAGA